MDGWVATKCGLRDCYAHKNIIFPGSYDESYVTYSLEEIRRDEVTNEKRRERRRSHSAIRYDSCNVYIFLIWWHQMAFIIYIDRVR